MTVTDTPAVADAIETAKVSSHLHPEVSFEVDDHPVPTGREEVWRFTPLKRLRGLHQDADLTGDTVKVESTAPEGVRIETVDASDSPRGSSGLVPVDRISARVWHAATRVTTVTIPRETVLDEPVFVDLSGVDAEGATAGHVVVTAEAHSKGTVVFRFTGSATLADLTEVVVGDGAQLTVVSIDDWADDAVHVGHRHAKVGRDATFKHVDVSFGGDVVRHDTTAEYAGPGGSVEMLGLYFADEGQHIEHRLFVDHNAPNTKSHVVYKGALQGEGAHTVWIGNVLIRKVAEGIETFEENRNLVLTDGCQADSVPEPGDRDRRDRGRGPRVRDRPLRRRAAVLPPLARHRGVRGTPPGRARLLQRPDPQDRRTRPRGAAVLDGGGGAGEERPEGLQLMAFSRVCAFDEVPDDEALGVTVGSLDLAIARHGDEVFAVQDLCSHAAVALSEGEVTDCTVECWLHGSRFDLRTGKPIGPPATEPVSTFAVELRDGDVYVDTTEPLNGVLPS